MDSEQQLHPVILAYAYTIENNVKLLLKRFMIEKNEMVLPLLEEISTLQLYLYDYLHGCTKFGVPKTEIRDRRRDLSTNALRTSNLWEKKIKTDISILIM